MSHILKSVTLTWLTSGAAIAGWNSGGGHLFTDEHNPWFVHNTTIVRYCIDIDEENFGQTAEVARENIQAAAHYWQREFAIGQGQAIGAPYAVATQSFVEEACTGTEDIKFQFGTLSTEQLAYLRRPKSIVSIAVRTDYDPVNLRGKGFVYVSPVAGPLSLDESGLGGGPLPDRWRHAAGKNLELVLVHELGHVFGLTHHGEYSVMDERWPMLLASNSFGGDVTEDYVNEPFFLPRTGFLPEERREWTSGSTSRSWIDVFGATRGTQQLTFTPRGTQIVVSEILDGSRRDLGVMADDGWTGTNSFAYIELYLTPAQSVLDLQWVIPPQGQTLSMYFTDARMKVMTFRSISGARRQVYVRVEANDGSILGVDASGAIHARVAYLEPLNWGAKALKRSR